MTATCPRCGTDAPLSDAPEQGVIFAEPMCAPCRDLVVRELLMDAFDELYARLTVNGWAD